VENHVAHAVESPRALEATRRTRARDERVSVANERIGWGGCGAGGNERGRTGRSIPDDGEPNEVRRTTEDE